MTSKNDSLDEDTRLANSDKGRRLELTSEQHDRLWKDINQAMAEVYANRASEIPGASACKSYNNSIVSYEIAGVAMYTFGVAFLPYLNVRDKCSMSGHSTNVSINLETSKASVQCERRAHTLREWRNDDSFGIDGRFSVLFSDLTVEGATRTANALVDAVKAHVDLRNTKAESALSGARTPFMTHVAGHVLIHEHDTGKPLLPNWTGICVDGGDSTKYWYIGQCEGERSFSALSSRTLAAAILEAKPIINFESELALDEKGA